MKLTTIHIKDLRLRTFIGFNEEELLKKQDVVINIDLDYDATKAMSSDSVDDACNYKVLTKKIIQLVENTRYNLLEKMSADILSVIQTDSMVFKTKIEIDKPHALRFSDSVSIELIWEK